MNEHPVSKILVLDESTRHAPTLKRFCDENNLVPMKIRAGSIMSVLATNIDLGCILCSETYGGTPAQTLEIATRIHTQRPELPIILRRESRSDIDDLSPEARRIYCAAYTAGDMGALRKAIDEYIFCLIYPNALLRGIGEIIHSVLKTQCPGLEVSREAPYIVRDRVIFGELFSLIHLESAWCRGYMTLQTEEQPFIELLGGRVGPPAVVNFRQVNDLLGEMTNLVWGAFKNRYIGESITSAPVQVQVPLIVNHKQKYISFGTENPQLCFRFALMDVATGRSTTLYARFVFNLSWLPELFHEIPQDATGLVESGALELF